MTTLTIEPTASDAITTLTTEPTTTIVPDVFTPSATEATPGAGEGATKSKGGFGVGAGTALGAGLFVLIGGVFFLRKRGKEADQANDATTAQSANLEGDSNL
jgi:hypothetical protein